MQFWFIRHSSDPVQKFEANSAGLKELAKSNTSSSDGKLYVNIDSLTEEETVNLVALLHKGWKHLSYLLGLTPHTTRRCKVWSRFRKNIVDGDNGEGAAFEVMLKKYLGDNISNLTYSEKTLIFSGLFTSGSVVAAVAGRVVNAARWSQSHTHNLRLLSEAELSWKSFNDITMLNNQPIVRRLKR